MTVDASGPDPLECPRLAAALHPLATVPSGPGWNHAELVDLLLPDAGHRAAAVLIGLVPRPSGLQVLLTRRTDGLRHHAGQVSFPGGRIEPDDEDAVAAAIRETGEELGIDASLITPLGFLDPLVTITGFRVVPVVARLCPSYVAVPDPGEVAEAFEVPLGFLLDPANLEARTFELHGRPRRVWEYRYPAQRIWGATASMLLNFRHRLERAMNEWTTLVSAEDLHAALDRDNLVVLDARVSLTDRGAGEAMYREGHIPGARHADLDRDLSDHRKPHAGRHPWPDAADFCAALQRWGVHAGDQVIVYDAGDGALAAARAWFLLRALGHRNVAVLDGGWTRWCALGLPVDTEVPTPRVSNYDASFDESRLLDASALQAHLRGGGVLLDARAAERFRGDVEPLDRVAGHVPGATNRPYAANLRDGRFKPAHELAAEFADAIGARLPQDVVAMCGSGVTACHHLLAMEHAGLQGSRLFTGSWSGWIDDPSRPVARGD